MNTESPPDGIDLSWGVRQRLAFIESRVFWDGGVNRPDLIAGFEISVTQASLDLTLYQTLAPDNLRYDTTRKCYVASPSFQPRFIELDGDAYLRRQHATDGGPNGIPYERLPLPGRRIDPHALRSIVSAVRGRQSIEIHYASSSDAEPGLSWRRVSPHAFAHDGLRWHVRAYCHRSERFMDFVVSRAVTARSPGPAGRPASDDSAWHSMFPVVLCPNPRLPARLQQIAAADFGMTDGHLTIHVRGAMLYYFSKRLRLDLAQQARDPREVPVIAKNRADLAAAIAQSGLPDAEPGVIRIRRRR